MSVVYKMGIAAHFGLTKFYLKIVEIYTFCNFLGGSKKSNKTCKFHQFLSKNFGVKNVLLPPYFIYY